MIIIEISGGLGNQMFQYALGQRFVSMGKEVKYDLSFYNENVQTLRKFELDIFHVDCPVATEYELRKMGKVQNFFDRISRKFYSGCNKIYKENLDAGYQPEIFELYDTYLSGYWQSEKYFKDIRDRILAIYRMPEGMNRNSKELLSKMQNENSVSIHIRRGDYLSKENYRVYGGICTTHYYKKAFEYVRENLANPRFYIFTNDIEWVKQQFKGDDMWIVECNNNVDNYFDMFLMSNCKSNIVANSTFSWWGAWLNQNTEKIVISPDKWFRNHSVSSAICDDWIRISE